MPASTAAWNWSRHFMTYPRSSGFLRGRSAAGMRPLWTVATGPECRRRGAALAHTGPVDRTPEWPPAADVDPKRVAKWARGRLTVAGVPRPTRVVAELDAPGEWRGVLPFSSPPPGGPQAAPAAPLSFAGEITPHVLPGWGSARGSRRPRAH